MYVYAYIFDKTDRDSESKLNPRVHKQMSISIEKSTKINEMPKVYTYVKC